LLFFFKKKYEGSFPYAKRFCRSKKQTKRNKSDFAKELKKEQKNKCIKQFVNKTKTGPVTFLMHLRLV
jgi:hypothetical protein